MFKSKLGCSEEEEEESAAARSISGREVDITEHL
jgi:hypothetical protein